MNHKFSFASTLTVLVLATTAMTGSASPSHAATYVSIDNPIASSQSMLKNRNATVMSRLEELDLSTEQSDAIDAIRANMMTQIEGMLTPAQLDAFRQGRKEGSDMRSIMRGLGLNANQRSEIISLFRTTQAQIMSVLTPEQRNQIMEERPIDR